MVKQNFGDRMAVAKAKRATLNGRQEAFASGIAKGKTQGKAYKDAGYQDHDPNATRMIKKDKIKDRIAELQAKAANRATITTGTLVEMLIEDRELAREASQAGAAVSAVNGIGKLLGLITDKVQADVSAVRRVPTREELEARRIAWQPPERLETDGPGRVVN